MNTQFLLLVLGAIAANILVWTAMFIATKESSETVQIPSDPVLQPALSNTQQTHPILSPPVSLCYLINGTELLPTDPRPSLYDFTLYLGTDHESLNLRLRTLSPFIDTFYIAHPTESLRGDKIATSLPLDLLATTAKVVQFDVNLTAYIPSDTRPNLRYNAYERIAFDAAFLEFKKKAGTDIPNGAVVIAGRVDEIPRLRVIEAVKECAWKKGTIMYALDMERYLYGFQYRRLKKVVSGVFAKAVLWGEEAKLLDGGYMRDGNRKEIVIGNAGWYCESCFVNLTAAVERFPDWNKDDIPVRVEHGIYLDMETYSPIEFSHDVPKDLPPEILFNPERYSHMLQRRGLYAGFKDLREQLRLKNYKEYTCAELEGKDKPKDDKSDPKVYDFFMYNGEQDILEIRLNTMGPIVDKFLLAETNWTFTGKSKAFQFPGLMGTPGFTKYWDKIVHIQVDPPSSDIGNWERESHHRNRGLQQALHAIDIQEGDFLVIADLDEIIRPSLLAKLKTCTGFTKPHFTPLMPFHYFGFAYWHHRHYWPDGKVLRWTNKLSIDKFEAQGLRFDHAGGVQVKDAGWHCSWCFSNMSQVMSKVQSYSHQEHNQPEFLTRENILNGFRHGYDLFGRTYDQFKYIEDNQDLPDYVALNRDKYEYMLYRRNEWAGFSDVKEEIMRNTSLNTSHQYS
ncbi:hypothetical protein HDU79_001924 [Rhizoclosmatium sp. JEL0117]|nr:hypothetical protein HDU79_001924 [Rhizoclosmatium sp. JEL0117]